jgi:hypothetical protein
LVVATWRSSHHFGVLIIDEPPPLESFFKNMTNHKSLAPRSGYFAILFDGRVGSTYLASLLNQHPNILCYHEIFANQECKEEEILLDLVEGNPITNQITSDTQLSQDSFLSGKEELAAVGFKTKLCNIKDLSNFTEFLKSHDVKIIHLYRNNIVKSLISTFNGLKLSKMKSNQWNLYEDESTSLGALSIDPNEFKSWFWGRLMSEWVTQNFIADLPGEVLRVSYEDLTGSHDACNAKILNFLEFDNIRLKGKTKKMTSDKISEAVQNVDELLELFPEDHQNLRYFRQFFE